MREPPEGLPERHHVVPAEVDIRPRRTSAYRIDSRLRRLVPPSPPLRVLRRPSAELENNAIGATRRARSAPMGTGCSRSRGGSRWRVDRRRASDDGRARVPRRVSAGDGPGPSRPKVLDLNGNRRDWLAPASINLRLAEVTGLHEYLTMREPGRASRSRRDAPPRGSPKGRAGPSSVLARAALTSSQTAARSASADVIAFFASIGMGPTPHSVSIIHDRPCRRSHRRAGACNTATWTVPRSVPRPLVPLGQQVKGGSGRRSRPVRARARAAAGGCRAWWPPAWSSRTCVAPRRSSGRSGPLCLRRAGTPGTGAARAWRHRRP